VSYMRPGFIEAKRCLLFAERRVGARRRRFHGSASIV
jgi:hypothetical protein